MIADPDQGQCDGVCERHHVLPGGQPHPRRGQRGRLQRLCPAAGRHHAEERAGDHDSRRYSVQAGVYCAGNEGMFKLFRAAQKDNDDFHGPSMV